MTDRLIPTHRHIKTGGLYVELTRATWEATLEMVVVYLSLKDRHIWVRPVREFDDPARFEKLTP